MEPELFTAHEAVRETKQSVVRQKNNEFQEAIKKIQATAREGFGDRKTHLQPSTRYKKELAERLESMGYVVTVSPLDVLVEW